MRPFQPVLSTLETQARHRGMRARLWRLAAFLAASMAFSDPSAAAAPTIPPFLRTATPMAVRVVRNNDPQCRVDRCSDWIALDGLIGPGSAAKFERVVRGLGHRHLPVLINSPGGLVSEAMAIGRLIHEKRLDVAVTRTQFTSCPADREACATLTPDGLATGLPDSRRAFCASACPLILAAGTRRYVAPWAHVGVHQYIGFVREMKVLRLFRVVTRVVNGTRVEVSRTLVSEKPLPASAMLIHAQVHYADTAAYFASMGIGPGIMPLLRSAPSSDIDWLTPEDLLSTRLATDFDGGEDLVAPVHEPSALPVAAAPSRGPANATGSAKPSDAASSREIAAFIDDAGDGVNLISGHVGWSVEGTGGGASGAREPTLVASVALDDDAGFLTVRFVRDRDGASHSATRLLARLLPGARSPFGHAVRLGRPGLRKDAHAQSDTLSGHVEDDAPAVFSMLLSDTADDERRDMALLASDQWIDIPVVMDGNRTVRITFALGLSGSSAVRQWEAGRAARAAR